VRDLRAQLDELGVLVVDGLAGLGGGGRETHMNFVRHTSS
jgi:hypothetical protein